MRHTAKKPNCQCDGNCDKVITKDFHSLRQSSSTILVENSVWHIYIGMVYIVKKSRDLEATKLGWKRLFQRLQ